MGAKRLRPTNMSESGTVFHRCRNAQRAQRFSMVKSSGDHNRCERDRKWYRLSTIKMDIYHSLNLNTELARSLTGCVYRSRGAPIGRDLVATCQPPLAGLI